MDSFNNDTASTESSNPFDLSVDSEPLGSVGSDAAAKVAKFSMKSKIIAGVVAATVALGGGAAYALFNNSNVNLYVAMGSWFKSDVLDATISLQVKPEAFRRGGATDTALRPVSLPGVKTLDDFVTGLGQTKLRIQTNKSSGTIDESNYAISLQYGSANVADLRLVERVLYLRSDVSQLPGINPQVVTQADIDEFKTTIEEYGTFLGSDSFAVKLVATVLAGDTASLSLKSDTALGKVIDGALVQATAQPTPSMPATTELQKLVVDALKNASTIKSEGRDGTGNKFLLSVDLYKFGQALQQGIQDADLGVLEPYRSDIESGLSDLLAQVTSQSLQMRAWADRGNLKRIDLDLSQIINLSDSTAKLHNWDVAMQMDIGNESPAAPENSVDFTPDFDSLYQGLLSLGS